jgi:hypothetical protein
LFPKPANEFERLWLRTWLTVFLPGFAIFGLGALTDLDAVVIAGWLIAAVGLLRGFLLVRQYRRCTGCGFISGPRVGDDGSCLHCGVLLPLNGLDRPPGLD